MSGRDALSPGQFQPLPEQRLPIDQIDPEEYASCPGGKHTASCYHESGHAYMGDDEDPSYEINYVRKMAQNLDALPPIIAQATPEGRHRIWGGHHRLAAHNEVGASEIRARVIPAEASRDDAMKYIMLHEDDD